MKKIKKALSLLFSVVAVLICIGVLYVTYVEVSNSMAHIEANYDYILREEGLR